MGERHALVAGATGLVGRKIAERLHQSGWRVTGLCRNPPAGALAYSMLAVDLTNAADCTARLSRLDHVTDVFYAARYDHPEGRSESVDVNTAMLQNLIDAVEPRARGLRHVHLVHGTKYDGHMLGPLEVPLSENSPRARVPNFYFEQEDFLMARQRGRAWSLSTSRPHTFCDDSAEEPRNAALLIAVHASLARQMGAPFFYPGTDASFHVQTQFTYVPMLARAIEWMATSDVCANQSYNIVNGDAPRWSELWPQFAEYFGIECGRPSKIRLADYIADKDAAWQALVARHGLKPGLLSARALWPYADYLFRPEWDIISSMSKARRDGFRESIDSARMFIDRFDRMRAEKIIP